MAATILPDLFDVWDYDDPAGTAVRFRELLQQVIQPSNIGYHIELLTQIARAEGLQGHFAEAHVILDEAEAMLTPSLPIAQMRCLLERGRVFNSAGEVGTAVPLFQKAYDLGLKTGSTADFFTIDAAHMLGIATAHTEEQFQWNLVALELTRQSPDKRAQGWCGSLLNNIGWTYFAAGEVAKALAIFEEAVIWFQTNRPDDGHVIRIANWSVARTWRALRRLDEALTMQQTLLAEMEAAGAAQDGFVFEELGECLLALQRGEEARPFFTQAYTLLSQLDWLANSEPARLERLKELGN